MHLIKYSFFLQKIKIAYKKIVPISIRVPINDIKNRINGRIKRKLGSCNKKTTFYLIQKVWQNCGPLTTWAMIMPYVKDAMDRGYIPFIDQKNVEYSFSLLDKDNYGKINPWELYFEQPQRMYSLENILKSKKVIIPHKVLNKNKFEKRMISRNIPMKKDEFIFWRKMYEICPLSSDIILYAENLKLKIFPKSKKVLGVSYRREFEWDHYMKLSYVPDGTHLFRIDLNNLIIRIKEELQNLNYDYLFITVDDRESKEIIKNTFKEKCIFQERKLPHYFKNGNFVAQNDKELRIEYTVYSREEENKKYLTDIYLLSKCDSLLSAGHTQDTFAYLINNNRFEHIINV